MSEKVLEVPAWVDRAGHGDPQWVATVNVPGSPLSGLFAFGDDFTTARRALATTVWAAVCGGALPVAASDFAAVRILAVTRKTFPVEGLGGDAT